MEPGYVLEPDCNNQANQLREDGRQFYDVKYKSHFDNLFNSAGEWFRAFGKLQFASRAKIISYC